MTKITCIIGREVLDSRGNPTVEADVRLDDDSWGRATVPSGASVGAHEAHELRDDDKQRYNGLGVLGAVSNINNIIAHDLVGLEVDNQRALDERLIALDGTADKSHLGANAILATSIALVKAAAMARHQPIYRFLGSESANLLPVPMMNIINGGKHATDSIDFQECMIMPIGAENFQHALQMGLEIYHTLKDLISAKGLSTTIGDEGGFGLQGVTNDDALELMMQAIEKANYQAGKDVYLALDPASSAYYENGIYQMKRENKSFTPAEMQDYFMDLMSKYPIFSIEDPLFEDDWDGYAEFTAKVGAKVQIVGDDLFVTNQTRLQNGIAKKCANAILIKPNQIGTVTETINTITLAKKNNFATIISHRSADTVDPFIADLCVAFGCGQIKTGAPARSERTAKYNQLLRIEEMLGARARYADLV